MTTRLEAFGAEVEAELNDPTVKFVYALINEGKHGQRRRIHWYREGGQIVAPDMFGGRIEQPGNTATGIRSPALWMRLETVRCDIFAEDDETVETLFDLLIVAINNAVGEGSIDWQGYEWRENEIAQRIPMIILRFTAAMPVREEQKQLREIEGVEDTCELETG